MPQHCRSTFLSLIIIMTVIEIIMLKNMSYLAPSCWVYRIMWQQQMQICLTSVHTYWRYNHEDGIHSACLPRAYSIGKIQKPKWKICTYFSFSEDSSLNCRICPICRLTKYNTYCLFLPILYLIMSPCIYFYMFYYISALWD